MLRNHIRELQHHIDTIYPEFFFENNKKLCAVFEKHVNF